MSKSPARARPDHSPVLATDIQPWRARLVLVLLMAGSVALLARAAWLQGFNAEFLQAEGESRYAREIKLPAHRGRITDRNGVLLAASAEVSSVRAHPRELSLSPEQARHLAQLLGIDVETLHERTSVPRGMVYLARGLSPARADEIRALGLSGISFENDFRRYYPLGSLVAHVVGFTDVDEHGIEGVELAYDATLAGKPGSRQVIRSRRGSIVEVSDDVTVDPQHGRDLTLSLDVRLQDIAATALAEAVSQHRARAGAAVVLDAQTGEVLALVNQPTYNPNNRSEFNHAVLRNRAVTDVFEPGSTMKPLVVGRVLDRGDVGFATLIDTEHGRMTLSGRTITDTHRHEKPLTVSEVVQKSSNVGTVKMAMRLSPAELRDHLARLGFGRPVGLGFPGEAGGVLRDASRWRPIEQATMSYGYGLSASLLQIARAYLAFARDGEVLPLSLVRVDGPPSGDRVFSHATAEGMRKVLESAAGPGGTAPLARVGGYRVAGKTGTAHKLVDGRYADKYVASFVGLAPVSHPRVVVAVMIDEPSAGKHYGGQVSAPVFARITEGALRLLGVTPDAPLQVAQPGVPQSGSRGAL